MSYKKIYLLANFGGPRHKEEIYPFLRALLNDRDVIWTTLPSFAHKLLFTYVAKKRAKTISHDYDLIGGKSPIYDDTEKLAALLQPHLDGPIWSFHRYLPETHPSFLEKLQNTSFDECVIFPLFPQFSYATTGSIARFFLSSLPFSIVKKMRWVFSYAGREAYTKVMQKSISDFLQEKKLEEKDVVLFFSAHGVPKSFICMGDIYQRECETSYETIKKAFPLAHTLLAYQSQFGKGEWLRPSTLSLCEKEDIDWAEGRKNVVFIPLSFTSDHIETLFEVEKQYLPLLEKRGLKAFRSPALNHRSDWVEAISSLLSSSPLTSTEMLIRPAKKLCCPPSKTCKGRR